MDNGRRGRGWSLPLAWLAVLLRWRDVGLLLERLLGVMASLAAQCPASKSGTLCDLHLSRFSLGRPSSVTSEWPEYRGYSIRRHQHILEVVHRGRRERRGGWGVTGYRVRFVESDATQYQLEEGAPVLLLIPDRD